MPRASQLPQAALTPSGLGGRRRLLALKPTLSPFRSCPLSHSASKPAENFSSELAEPVTSSAAALGPWRSPSLGGKAELGMTGQRQEQHGHFRAPSSTVGPGCTPPAARRGPAVQRLLMGATVCREQPGNGACLGVQDTLKHHTGSGSQLGSFQCSQEQIIIIKGYCLFIISNHAAFCKASPAWDLTRLMQPRELHCIPSHICIHKDTALKQLWPHATPPPMLTSSELCPQKLLPRPPRWLRPAGPRCRQEPPARPWPPPAPCRWCRRSGSSCCSPGSPPG